MVHMESGEMERNGGVSQDQCLILRCLYALGKIPSGPAAVCLCSLMGKRHY